MVLAASPFTYTPTGADWLRILPTLILFATALVTLLADLVAAPGRKGWLSLVGLLGVAGAGVAVVALYASGETGSAFYGMINADPTALVADGVVLFAVAIGLLLSPGYIERQGVTQEGEYYALLLLAATGMTLMASAGNLMIVFVGLEVLSLPLYILSAYITTRARSQEAGMKYFILSSFASAFLLYGMALTYGATGQTALSGIRDFINRHPFSFTGGYGPLLLVGLGLMVVGFLFKVSAIPFQAWTPDVYVGAPTTVTAFMSVGTKVAAFVGLARVFIVALGPLAPQWEPVIWAAAMLTMVGGNLLAVTQRDVKRLLAYSSVANAGYMLVAVVTHTTDGVASLLFYLAGYAVMNLGAFAVVLTLEGNDGQGTLLTDFNGLSRRRPAVAAAMALFLFALAGIPATAGFTTKFYVFYSAIQDGRLELAIVGLLASVLGMFYYLRVIWAMYFVEPFTAPEPAPLMEALPSGGAAQPDAPGAPTRAASGAVAVAERRPATRVATRPARQKQPIYAPVPLPVGVTAALALCALLTLALGIVPGPLLDLAHDAARTLLAR